MAGRLVAGTGQILLAVAGFGMVMGWFVWVAFRAYQEFRGEAEPRSFAWLGEAGAATFAGAWLWALVTSLSLLREARANEKNNSLANPANPQ